MIKDNEPVYCDASGNMNEDTAINSVKIVKNNDVSVIPIDYADTERQPVMPIILLSAGFWSYGMNIIIGKSQYRR